MTTQALRANVSNEASTTAVRNILFVSILLLAWVSVNPFPNLTDTRLITIYDTSDLLNQLAYVVLAGAITTYFLINEPWRVKPLVRVGYLAMVGWLAVAVATSTDPSLSARRVLFSLLVIVLAAAVPLLPANVRKFCEMTGAVVSVVLIICYAGLLLAPHLAIHQPDDVVEPHLAGNWRGLYSHKNVAGSIMANFVIIGLFIARARSKALGYSIAAAAGVFLFFCEAKASTALLPLALLLSFAVMRIRSRILCAAIIFAPFIALNLFTVGSLHFEAIGAFNKAVMSDPTFTGRVDIWQFALDNIVKRPWLGHGFGAFWETPVTFFTPSYDGSMATHASHAHNAIFDLVLTIGLIGLIPAVVWTMALPFWDWTQAMRRGAESDLTTLFLRIWMFALYTCAFESVLFNRGDPQWFTMLIAMFGLRYLSVSRLESGRGNQ